MRRLLRSISIAYRRSSYGGLRRRDLCGRSVTLGASTGVDTSNDDEYSIPPLEGDDPWPVQLSDEECLPLYQEQQVTPFSVLAEAEPPLYQEHQVTPPPLAEGESPPYRTQGQERF